MQVYCKGCFRETVELIRVTVEGRLIQTISYSSNQLVFKITFYLGKIPEFLNRRSGLGNGLCGALSKIGLIGDQLCSLVENQVGLLFQVGDTSLGSQTEVTAHGIVIPNPNRLIVIIGEYILTHPNESILVTALCLVNFRHIHVGLVGQIINTSVKQESHHIIPRIQDVGG